MSVRSWGIWPTWFAGNRTAFISTAIGCFSRDAGRARSQVARQIRRSERVVVAFAGGYVGSVAAPPGLDHPCWTAVVDPLGATFHYFLGRRAMAAQWALRSFSIAAE